MNYAHVLDLLQDVNAEGVTAGHGDLARSIEEASKAFETAAGGRQFYSTLETRYFDGDGKSCLWVGDLLSITTLKFDDDGDGTYEETLDTGDYWLWPDNVRTGYGYRRIDLNPEGDYSAFPTGRRKVQIVGKFGFSEITKAVVGAAQITGTVGTTSGLTITASATVASLLSVGDTFFLGTEEMGPIVSPPTVSILVEARGINGTTAATHSAVDMYQRRFPADIERAVRADAARYLWSSAQGQSFDGTSTFRERWPAISAAMASYTDPAAVF